jgi:hypothetical protein
MIETGALLLQSQQTMQPTTMNMGFKKKESIAYYTIVLLTTRRVFPMDSCSFLADLSGRASRVANSPMCGIKPKLRAALIDLATCAKEREKKEEKRKLTPLQYKAQY